MIGPLFAWFNVFAFVVCLDSPRRQLDAIGGRLREPSISIVYAVQGGAEMLIDVWTLGDTPARVCVNGACNEYPAVESSRDALCRAAFDADGDGAVTLRDWAALMVGVVWCEEGRCLRVIE